MVVTAASRLVVPKDTPAGEFRHYMPGLGANWNDSSARISLIEDARAPSNPSGGDPLYSYSFSYTPGAGGLSYLSSITSAIGTPENYTFTINQGQTRDRSGCPLVDS